MITKDILRKYPKVREILLKYGMCDCCGGHLTLEQGAKGKIDELLKKLSGVIDKY